MNDECWWTVDMTEGNSRTLSIASLAISLLVLVIIVTVLIIFFTSHSDLSDILNSLVDQSQAPPQHCLLSPDPGPCSSRIDRWYYLDKIRDCLELPWGGCHGNDNNFVSLRQCRESCGVSSPSSSLPRSSSSSPSVSPVLIVNSLHCSLPPDSGPCDERVVRYYHDHNTNSCLMFEYGGCAGNNNNFISQQHCETVCRDTKPTFSPRTTKKRYSKSVSTCSQPEVFGSCSKNVTRYRWDPASDECVMFYWSGCGGNSNNFRTREKCQQRCKL